MGAAVLVITVPLLTKEGLGEVDYYPGLVLSKIPSKKRERAK